MSSTPRARPWRSDRDYAWMPDGKTIVMSAGTKVWSWTRGAAGWVEVFDAVALVVAEPKRP